MEIKGEKMQALLIAQWETVTLVAADGTERRGISPKFAAAEIAGRAFTGYGSDGIVREIRADDMPRRGPFARRRDVTAVMSEFPRMPHVQRNPHPPLGWSPQLRFVPTGHAGKVTTLFKGGRQCNNF